MPRVESHQISIQYRITPPDTPPQIGQTLRLIDVQKDFDREVSILLVTQFPLTLMMRALSEPMR